MIGRATLCSLVLTATLACSTAAAAGMGTVTKSERVGPYRLVLIIGPAETMSMKGTGSEHMTGGMSAMCKMAMSGMGKAGDCNHHVELHVYDKKGMVVTKAHVTMTLVNTATHRSTMLPVATMMGKGGMKDFHYGNNAYLPTGLYTVEVRVNKTSARFTVRL